MRSRKPQQDRLLAQLPMAERRRQIHIRQQIAREYMGLPSAPGVAKRRSAISNT